MKCGKKIIWLECFLIVVMLFVLVDTKKVYASGQMTMYVGDTETFNANINTYDTIKSYSWTLSGSGAVILNKSAHSCQVVATSTGKATLSYSVTSTYTYYIYTDVQRTKKKYITNTQVNRASWVITAGTPVAVSFDANGGSVGMTSKQVACGGEANYGELPVPTFSGHVFDGWYTEPTGGTLVTNDTVVSKGTAHTLYAHWIENFSYTIHFDGNGNTGGTMEDMSCLYGDSYYLTNNAFVKNGNRFVCWSTTKDGTGVRYANKNLVKNLRKTAGTITLYAVWSDENIANGTHGDNLTWIIDAEGTLVISGSGAMSATKPSWKSYIEKISKVVIEEGVTTISEEAFCVNNYTIKTVEIPDTVTTISAGAFWACRELERVVIPDSVTYIGENAFYNCDSLEEVTLGENVKTIGDNAFMNCNFKFIHIPASVNYIGEAALSTDQLKGITVSSENPTFCSDDGILFDKAKTTLISFPSVYGKSVYMIPDGVTTIGDGAFQKTIGTKTIIFPESVMTIGLNCFYDNTTIRYLYFRGAPPSLKKEVIVEGMAATSWAFNNVTATIYYPSAKSSLWASAKSDYDSACLLDAPTLTWYPYTLNTSMQNCIIERVDDEIYSYDGQEKQPKVMVYDQGMKLYEGTDYEVSYENNIDAGNNTAKVIVTGLNDYADTTNELTFTIEKAQQMPTFAVVSESIIAGDEIIIENVSGYGEISYLSKNTNIATVTSDGVIVGEKVGEATIEITADGDKNHESGTEQLSIVVVHNDLLVPEALVAEKVDNVFCIGNEIDLSDLKVEALYSDGYAESVEKYITDVSSLDVSAVGKKTINISYTKNDQTIETNVVVEIVDHTWDAGVVTKEATTTQKGEKTYTCSVCKTTKKEEIPALGVPKVGEQVTSDNGATYKVTATGENSGSITYVASADKKATTVVIPATITIDNITYKVTKISDTAFAGNKNLTSVTIGNNVTGISAKTFKGCTNLKTVTIGNGVTSIPANTFKNFKKLVTVKMGTGVKSIGKDAFNGCSKLKNVTIGKNVTFIGDKAFYKCTALTKVSLPDKVKTIGKQAFYGCKNVTSVTIGKNVTKIGSKAFYGCSKIKTLTIKSTKLTTKKTGSSAFGKTPKSMTVKAPTKKKGAYKSMLIKRGVNKKAKFKKI